MSDEYKILQDKIDKIGGFGFTIKGWSVTAVIAATAAGSTANRLLTVAMVSLGLAVMLIFFFRFELRQVRLSRLFGERARKLENTFKLIDRGDGRTKRARIPVPYTAHEIILAGLERKLSGRDPRKSSDENKLSRRSAQWWGVARQADVLFYFVLICLAFLPLLPRYGAIGWHWNQWVGKIQHHLAGPAPRPPSRAIEVPK
jgi:hypothetical protein